MRYSKILEIINLLNTFIKRNVFNVGILKNKVFRFMIIAGVVIIVALISILIFIFFDNSQSSIKQTTFVLDIHYVSIMMWTFVVFLFMKILFMKKNSFMIFTQQLPATKREKNIALLCFEVSISIIIVSIISCALVIALIFKYKFIFITRMICNVLFGSITYYLFLELIYSLLIVLLDFFKLSKIKDISIYCAFTIIFLIMYKIVYYKIVDKLLFEYVDGKSTSAFLVYSYIMDKYSFIISLLVFLVITCVLIILILSIRKQEGFSTSKYLKLGKKNRKISFIACYLLNFSRGVETYNYLIILTFLYFLLLITGVSNAIYALLLLSLNGIYSYIQTQNLRMLIMQKEYSAVKDYIYLVLSQYIYIFCVSIPFIIISWIVTRELVSNILLFPSIALSVIIFTLIGIVIPPKRENPFTVMVGFVVIFVLSCIIVLICFITNFQSKYNIAVLVGVIIFSVYYSISGLCSLKEEIRFEK